MGLLSSWVYYHISNTMQYSNTAMDNTPLVMCDSKSFSYLMPLFLMALNYKKVVIYSSTEAFFNCSSNKVYKY